VIGVEAVVVAGITGGVVVASTVRSGFATVPAQGDALRGTATTARTPRKANELRSLSPAVPASSARTSQKRCSRTDIAHVLDDLSTSSMDNVRHLKAELRFGCAIETCASPSIVAELVDEAHVVYHLAAAVGVNLIVESPVRTIETNVHCKDVVLAQASKSASQSSWPSPRSRRSWDGCRRGRG